jgi:hypothetical protein
LAAVSFLNQEPVGETGTGSHGGWTLRSNMKETKSTKQAKPGRRDSANASAKPARASGANDETIARRAHELFQERGGLDGHDLDDWLEAERQIGAVKPTTSRS